MFVGQRIHLTITYLCVLSAGCPFCRATTIERGDYPITREYELLFSCGCSLLMKNNFESSGKIMSVCPRYTVIDQNLVELLDCEEDCWVKSSQVKELKIK